MSTDEIDRAKDRLDSARRLSTIADENVARATLWFVKVAVQGLMPEAQVLTLSHVGSGFHWSGFARTREGGMAFVGVQSPLDLEPIQSALAELPSRGIRVWSQALFVPDTDEMFTHDPETSRFVPSLDLDKVTREPE